MRTEAEIVASWDAASPPLVSVVCPVYNQERYVLQCVHSLLAQETRFPFEIIIHDDASTDSTPSLVAQLVASYPSIVRAMYQTDNQYSRGVKITPLVVPHARGRYIAFCEGDDYWTSPHKLQRQVDVLEADPRLMVCGHLHVTVDANGQTLAPTANATRWPERFTIRHGMCGAPLHPNTWVYRRFDWAANHYSDLLNSLPAADDPMLLILLTRGEGYCIRERWSAYRLHAGGSWSTKSDSHQRFDMLRFQVAALGLVPRRLKLLQCAVTARSVGHLYVAMARGCVNQRSLRPAREVARQFRRQNNVSGTDVCAATVGLLILSPGLLVHEAWGAARRARSTSESTAE